MNKLAKILLACGAISLFIYLAAPTLVTILIWALIIGGAIMLIVAAFNPKFRKDLLGTAQKTMNDAAKGLGKLSEDDKPVQK